MGLGNSGCGTTPFGYGTPAAAADPPSTEAGASGCRYISPNTRDYEFDGVSRQLKQMPSLRQRVLIRVLTAIGSSTAQPKFGIKLPRTMGDGFEKQVENSVRAAFYQESDVTKVMRINSVTVVKLTSGRASVTIEFTDMTTGTSDSVTV